MNARALLRVATALGLSVSISACGGGSKSASPVIPGPAHGANDGLPYGESLMKQAQFVEPAHFKAMAVDVAVKLQNESALESYAQDVSNPASGMYRRYLTPQEIGERFGASASDYAATAAYFSSHNLHVGGWPQRLSLVVSGRQADLEAAFGTAFGTYRLQGQTFIAPMSKPSFPKVLPIRAIGNIVRAQATTRDFVPRIGTGDSYGYSPQQLRKVFDYQSAYNDGFTGAGVTIGIIGTGPIAPGDAPAYGALYHTAVATITQVNATDQGVAQALGTAYPTPPPFNYSTGLSSPPPATGPCTFTGDFTTCNPEDGEAQLDSQQVAGLAPGASVKFYLAYNSGECFQPGPGVPNGGSCGTRPSVQAQGIELADDEIQQIIADNAADVVSGSYGGGESQYGEGNEYDPVTKQGIGPAEFAALAAEGIAVFFSTGDSGAEGCLRYGAPGPLTNALCVGYPSTDPNVVAVGGVTTPMDSMGNLTNALTGWGVATSGGGPQYGNAGFGGSGGGCSIDFALPPWESAAGVSSMCSMRANPDVSLEADLATGVTVVQNVGFGGPSLNFYGGTSVAAPEMAAMWSLVVQACKQTASCATAGGAHPYRLGNAAPYLYAIYANKTIGSFTPHLANADVFYDVLYGFNGMAPASPIPSPTPSGGYDPGYYAGLGFDLVTGIGVPYARHLIKAVVNI